MAGPRPPLGPRLAAIAQLVRRAHTDDARWHVADALDALAAMGARAGWTIPAPPEKPGLDPADRPADVTRPGVGRRPPPGRGSSGVAG